VGRPARPTGPREPSTHATGVSGPDRRSAGARRAPADAALADVALAGASLADLHGQYRSRLEAVAFRLLRDHDEAEDVVQHVFEALPRADFRGRSSVWTYLYRAAVNGALSALRKHRRRESARTELRVRAAFGHLVEAEQEPDPEARVLEGEILSAVASALLHVKPQHRRALVLRIVWGFTNTEIAEREGVPLPTVGTWLRRGREELRAHLGPLLRDLDLGEDGP
jgi:RNA polymerase sigma-70 factor (ECF subfamily)